MPAAKPPVKRRHVKKPDYASEQVIEAVRNLGPISARWLRTVHIESFEQLQQTGAMAAFLQVRSVQPSVNINLLWALIGALGGRDWRALSASEKHAALDQLAHLQLRLSND